MRIDVVSIFPDYFAPLGLSLIGRARTGGLVRIEVHDLREWTTDRHRTVDDTPYGGGAGMVMRPEPWGAALDFLLGPGVQAPDAVAVDARGTGTPVDAPTEAPCLVVPTPAGERFTQQLAGALSRRSHLVFACGRYEGIDQRVTDHYAGRLPVFEVSLGDYVVNGGEVAALVMIEAVVRLLPGVVGNPESLLEESHGERLGGELLEYPVYTKPPVWRGLAVPQVLLSGHHANVAHWRHEQARRRTAERRPDLVRRSDAADVATPPRA